MQTRRKKERLGAVLSAVSIGVIGRAQSGEVRPDGVPGYFVNEVVKMIPPKHVSP